MRFAWSPTRPSSHPTVAAGRKPAAQLRRWLALLLGAGALACTVARLAAAERFEQDGIAVEFSLVAPAGEPRAGAPARVRFALTDTTTGQPVRRLHPAAWLSRRGANAGRPRTCAEKVQELLGGSIFSRAELDLNTFQVLALNDDATITVVDPLFGFGGTKLLALVALPGVGADWALAAGNTRLLVSVPDTGQVAVVDTATWTVTTLLATGAAPRRIAIQPDGHYAWIEDRTGATVIDVDRATIAAHVDLAGGARDIVFSADSRWAFVPVAETATLAVIDVRTLTKSAEIALPCHPTSAAYSAQSQAIYVTDAAAGKIVAIDANTHAIVAQLEAEPGIATLRFSPGDRFALAANPARDLVLVLDAATNRLVQRAHVPGGPEQFAFSNHLAFVRRRDSASVGMIPLKEIGHDGAALPLAEFVGGEAAFGARTTPADAIVQAPGESAVVVANARDKAIYYYMEGMAAPMGNFSNYGRQPRAVRIVDRSLRETAPGLYESDAVLPAAGDYDAILFLNQPRIVHCFSARIAADPAAARSAGGAVRLVPQTPPALVAGQPAELRFHLAAAPGTPARAVPDDLAVFIVRVPGSWHQRLPLARTDDGAFRLEFTPPTDGVYQFHAESPSLGLTRNQSPCLMLRATAAPPASVR